MPWNLRTHRLNERRGTFLGLDTRHQVSVKRLDSQIGAIAVKLEFATTPDAGIEVAGEMNDFLRESVRYYDRIDLQDIGVTVLEHGSRILPPMPEALVGVRRTKDDDAGGSHRDIAGKNEAAGKR